MNVHHLKLCAAVLCMWLLSVGLFADEPTLQEKLASLKARLTGSPLTSEEVQATLASSGNGEVGLTLQDFWESLGYGTNQQSNAVTGYTLRIFTPRAWIARMKQEAKRKYKAFEVADVTEEDRLPILRVLVSPSTPERVTAEGLQRAAGVDHVVLRSEDKKVVIQPLVIDSYIVEVSNAMGGRAELKGAIALFSMEELGRLRASGSGEFFVTVVGDKGNEKDFKVKRKHFTRLP